LANAFPWFFLKLLVSNYLANSEITLLQQILS
jgi:hypothetical protein